MADYTITPTNMRVSSTMSVTTQIGGEAFSAGTWVYQDPITRLYHPADCTSDVKANVRGQAFSACDGAGEPFLLAPGSAEYKPGAVMSVGADIVLSATPGKMCDRTDLVSGNFITRLGTATSTSIMRVNVDVTGVEL